MIAAQPDADVIIVGAGIAGASLATALARTGVDVTVLEAAIEYRDRVRGESLLAWGVREAQRLGVAKALLAAGAHVTPQWVRYSPLVPAADARQHPIPVGTMIPGVPGSLNLLHPAACAALAAAAEAAGAKIIPGARVTGHRAGPASASVSRSLRPSFMAWPGNSRKASPHSRACSAAAAAWHGRGLKQPAAVEVDQTVVDE
jgi:2-polyprenyl-6-methoxyphenol hydroxylase-like FAD-dependent oxidoreductase